MKFATLSFRLIMITALATAGTWLAILPAARSAVAEDWALPDPGDLELPGESLSPTDVYDDWSSSESAGTTESSVMTGPPQVLSEPAPDYGDCQPSEYDYWNGPSAMPVSSGTWLERGFWYAEADAVVAVRVWDRDRTLITAQDVNVVNRTFFPPFGLGSINLNTNRTIVLTGDHPGEDASVRTTLGRFLFRDEDNRDHTAELTAFGGGDWVQDHVLTSEMPFGLFTPFPLSGGNRAFDGSSRQEFIYSSRYNSFELNYRVKRRLGRDRMVMDPNGHWRREASNGLNKSFLIGLRYVELREIVDWTADDIFTLGDNGAYLINTDNDLFGFQMGAGFGYKSGRWSLGLTSKGGFYVNDADVHSQLNFTSDDTDDFDRTSTEDEFSFVGETSILGRWHVTPNFSLRAGWDIFFMESLALASLQMNFINDTSKIGTTGYSFYMGGSLGFEGYW